jgi:hypothetical protein
MTTTKNLHLRVWAMGAYTASQHEPGTNNYNILEHDGRGRYHLVSVHGSKWREAELRIGGLRGGPRVAFKVSASESQARIVTHWINFARAGAVASGNTSIHADNSVTWSQVTKQKDGSMVETEGDSSSKKSVAYDANGNVTSQFTQGESIAGDVAQVQSVQNNDGSSTQTTTQTKPVRSGMATKTETTQRDSGGNITSQKTVVTTKHDDGSVSEKTVEVDKGAGTTTETVSHASGNGSVTQTTVTDNTTGESVSTGTETITATDVQGNTVTNTITSVTSSDGFSATQVTAESSDGTTGYQQLTTDGQGNQTFTTSVTDRQGNTITQSVSSDASGNTTVTTTSTDASENGTRTTETYDANGNQTSSSTDSVSSGATPGGGGSGGGDGSGGDDSGSGGGGGGDDSGSGGGGSMPSDDGTDEGPRSPTSHVSMGIASLDFVTIDGNGDQGDGSEGDFGNEGNPRNIHIGQSLSNYASSVHQNGWGDASSENAPSVSQVNVNIPVPTTTDDWGDLNNPRAFTAFSMSLMIAAAGSNVASAASGVLRCLYTNAKIGAQLAQMAVEQR